MLATIDQISNSRVALNIVAGWNKPEYDALGMKLPATHEQRYGFAQEWCQIVRALWTRTETFDWEGQFVSKLMGKRVTRPQGCYVDFHSAQGNLLVSETC